MHVVALVLQVEQGAVQATQAAETRANPLEQVVHAVAEVQVTQPDEHAVHVVLSVALRCPELHVLHKRAPVVPVPH